MTVKKTKFDLGVVQDLLQAHNTLNDCPATFSFTGDFHHYGGEEVNGGKITCLCEVIEPSLNEPKDLGSTIVEFSLEDNYDLAIRAICSEDSLNLKALLIRIKLTAEKLLETL